MKLILTGATGFVGSAALDAALASPSITEVIALTRKPLQSENPKLQVIIHTDFSSYPPDLLDQLESAEGCIWAIGGKSGDFPSVEIARKVTVDYTVAFATAIAQRRSKSLLPSVKSTPFKFIYCSGRFAEPDPKKQHNLWLMANTRRLKGEAEAGLFKVADDSEGRMQVVSLRPGGILPVKKGLAGASIGTFGYVTLVVHVDVLANKMVELVIKGLPKDKTILENEDIKGGAKD